MKIIIIMGAKQLNLQTEVELLRTIVHHLVKDGEELYEEEYKKYALKKLENIKKKLIEFV
jgi:hypothetical protein